MRELIGHRVTDQGKIGIGLEGAQDVVEHSIAVGFFEIAALLDIGFFIDDARFERRKIGGDVGRQVIGKVAFQAASGQGLRRPQYRRWR